MRHAPEGEKKDGFKSWGTNDPEEVLADETNPTVQKLPAFLKPESELACVQCKLQVCSMQP